MASAYSLYILRCADNSLYTGITTDVERRLKEHAENRRGARYLRGRCPFELVFSMPVGSRSLALRLEAAVKRLTRRRKEKLLVEPDEFTELLAQVSGSSTANKRTG